MISNINFGAAKINQIYVQRAVASEIQAIDKITREKENRKALPWIMKVTLKDAANNPQKNILLVAKNKLGTIIGFARLYCRNDKTATFHEIAVSEAFKHQGVGKRLIEERSKLVKENGCEKIKFKSPIDLGQSHNFFAHLQFIQSGIEKGKKRLLYIFEKKI